MDKTLILLRRFLVRWCIAGVSLCFGLVTLAVLLWGTAWAIPRSDITSRGYEWVAEWRGKRLSGGPLVRPVGIAVSAKGEVYVVDAKPRVLRFSPKGQVLGTWGVPGDAPGKIQRPIDVALGPQQTVFVADFYRDRVLRFSETGEFLMEFGESGAGPGQLDSPSGLAVDGRNNIYVADFYNHRIQKFRNDGTFVKTIGRPGRIGDGSLNYPTGVEITPEGDLIVADAYNYQIHRFTAEGLPLGRHGYHPLWLWPRPHESFKGFKVPTGVAHGRDGFLHVADSGNHRIVMLSPEKEFVAQWKLPGPAPEIYSPEKLALSPDGSRIYAADLAGNRILVMTILTPSKDP